MGLIKDQLLAQLTLTNLGPTPVTLVAADANSRRVVTLICGQMLTESSAQDFHPVLFLTDASGINPRIVARGSVVGGSGGGIGLQTWQWDGIAATNGFRSIENGNPTLQHAVNGIIIPNSGYQLQVAFNGQNNNNNTSDWQVFGTKERV